MLGKSENEEGAENEGDPPAGKQNKTSINVIICSNMFFLLLFLL